MRMHLTTGQRAMTTAALANMGAGGTGINQFEKSSRTNSSTCKSNKDTADQLNVGTTAIKTTKRIKRDALDLAEKVKKGGMTLNAADNAMKGRQEKPKASTL